MQQPSICHQGKHKFSITGPLISHTGPTECSIPDLFCLPFRCLEYRFERISLLKLQVFDVGRYQESLAAYFALGQHQHINQILEILLGDTRAYVFFERSYGDMHSFVRTSKKLREDEAARLFYQIASAVAHCHDNGLVLRDLKLRKFVFKSEDR